MNENEISEKIMSIIASVESNYSNMTAGEKLNVLERLDGEWEELPESKFESADKAMLALFLMPEYIEVADFNKAEKWMEILLMDRLDDLSQTGFYRGVFAFEKGDYKGAYAFFDMAYKDSKKRAFQDEAPKYWDFYNNPDTYMKYK